MLRFSDVLCISVALALGACSSGHGYVPPVAAGTTTSSHAILSDITDAGVPKIAGTYDGTFTDTENGHVTSGTVVIVIKQKGATISGTFTVTVQGHTAILPFTGTVAQGANGIKFKVTNLQGRTAHGHATLVGKKLNGIAKTPAGGGHPADVITFKTVKTT